MRSAARIVYPAAVFALTLLAYALTMPRTITLEDAGLFQMVCHMDGIAHPPGYPLFTMLCKPLVQFPYAVNGNLMSAVFAALTAAMFYVICQRLRGDRTFACVAALAYGFSTTFWSQAIIMEVYTLAALMFMICWWLLIDFVATRKQRYWLLFCLAYGLSLSNHWPLMILSTPGLLLFLWPVRGFVWQQLSSFRFWLKSIGCLLAGLSPYMSLVLSNNPEIAVFGPVDSLTDFIRYVSRAAYSDEHVTAGSDDKFHYAIWMFKDGFMQFGWPGIPLLAAGIWVSARLLPAWFNIALWLIFPGSTLALVLLLNFEYSHFYKAVFRPYPIIAHAALAFWFALGVNALASVARQYAHWGRRVIVPVCVLAVPASNFAANDRSESRLVSRYGEAVLNSLPPESVLFTSGDNQTGVFGYLHHVKNIRPDVELRDWEDLVFSNRLAPASAPEQKQLAVAREFINSTSRPVFSLADRLSPAIDYGACYRFARAGGYGFFPELEAYLDYLLSLYLNGYIRDPHEEHFAYHLLIGYARQYLGYAEAIGRDELAPVRRERIIGLQRTFPGRLVTMERRVDAGGDKADLLEIAAAAESDIPEFATPRSLAVFYELYGRVLMIPPSRPAEARDYFRLSIESYPVSQNASICRLIEIYDANGNRDATSGLRARFPDAKCQDI